jgi:excisionase family DNA binding protein
MDEAKNITEAAKQIGVSAKTLRRYCIKRLINFYLTAGGHYRFRQSAIDLFLSQHKTIKPTDSRKRKHKKPKLLIKNLSKGKEEYFPGFKTAWP